MLETIGLQNSRLLELTLGAKLCVGPVKMWVGKLFFIYPGVGGMGTPGAQYETQKGKHL